MLQTNPTASSIRSHIQQLYSA